MDNKLLAQLRRWQLTVRLNCLFWLVMVGVGAWFGLGAWKERQQTNLATLQQGALRYMSANLQRELDQADQLLWLAASNQESGRGPAAAAASGIPLASSLICPGLTVLNARGEVLLSEPGGNNSLQETERLAADLAWHRANSTQQMHLSDIHKGLKNKELSWHVSRRINTASGEFAGLAACHIELRAFLIFGESRIFKNGTNMVASSDGQVLLQNTDAGMTLGEGRLSPGLLEHIRPAPDGAQAYLQLDPDGEQRYYSALAVVGKPLLWVNGISKKNLDLVSAPAQQLIGFFVGITGLLIAVATAAMLWGLRSLFGQFDLRLTDQQQLLEQAQSLQQVLSNAGAGQWQLHWPSMRLTVSNLLVQRLGLEVSSDARASALDGQSSSFSAKIWLRLIHPANRRLAADFAKAVGEGLQTQPEVTIRLRHQAGHFCWFRLSGQAQPDNIGQAQILNGLALDVSEQRFAREQVEDRTAQLDTMFSLSPDGLVVFDAQRVVKYANPAFERLSNGRSAQVKNMREAEFSSWLGSMCTAEHCFSGIALLRSKASADPSSAWELVTTEGPPSRVLRLSLVLSNAQSVSQILYLRDVTHETEVERVKNRFLTSAAHELRTPLASVVGFAEILVTHQLAADKQLEFARIVWRQSLHLSGILDELLDISRMDARGAAGWHLQVLDLAELAGEVLASFQPPAGHLRASLALSPMRCRVDPTRAQQVIRNVLSNAYQYSAAGSPVHISQAPAQLHPDNGAPLLGIEIQDAGCGMDEQELAQAFHRFYRADQTGSRPGTGLGLSLCQDIMKLLGGLILLRSAPQQGTTVTLLFVQANLPVGHSPPEQG